MSLFNLTLFNYYRRYKWTAANFTLLQNQLIGYSQTQLAALARDAVLQGLNQNGSSALNVNYLAGFAINSSGALLAKASNGSVAVTNNIKSLIVLRPVTTNINSIVRPTAPFDPVFLNTLQDSTVVSIDGDVSNYPSKAAGDVVLFGVVASGGSITLIDESQCELLGKTGELAKAKPHDIIVGNHREAHYRTLALMAAAVVSGNRVRVMDSEALTGTVTISVSDMKLDFDPGVAVTKSSAATGFILSGNGIRITGGRFSGFSTAGNKAIQITGNYCSIWGTRFATNDTDVDDTTSTNSLVGVISE